MKTENNEFNFSDYFLVDRSNNAAVTALREKVKQWAKENWVRISQSDYCDYWGLSDRLFALMMGNGEFDNNGAYAKGWIKGQPRKMLKLFNPYSGKIEISDSHRNDMERLGFFDPWTSLMKREHRLNIYTEWERQWKGTALLNSLSDMFKSTIDTVKRMIFPTRNYNFYATDIEDLRADTDDWWIKNSRHVSARKYRKEWGLTKDGFEAMLNDGTFASLRRVLKWDFLTRPKINRLFSPFDLKIIVPTGYPQALQQVVDFEKAKYKKGDES